MIDDDECGAVGGRGNRSTRRKPAHSATLSTTDPTWSDLGSNPGCRHGGKPATNRQSYGTAFSIVYFLFLREEVDLETSALFERVSFQMVKEFTEFYELCCERGQAHLELPSSIQ
jgi:hypothetical protein